MIDFERAKVLFDVIEKCVGHTGKFPFLQSAAFGELQALEESAKAASKQANEAVDVKAKAQAEIDRQYAEAEAKKAGADLPSKSMKRL